MNRLVLLLLLLLSGCGAPVRRQYPRTSYFSPLDRNRLFFWEMGLDNAEDVLRRKTP